MSFGSNMDFTKEMPNLLSLTASIVFNDLIGGKTRFARLTNEI